MFVLFATGVLLTGFARKPGQSPKLSQRVLALIAGIIHGRPLLDVSLTPFREGTISLDLVIVDRA